MLSVKFHNPDFPDEIVFDLGGIAVPNNGTVELDKDAELKFFSVYKVPVRDYFANSPQVEISGKTELSTADREVYPETEEASIVVEPEEGGEG